MFQLFMHSMLNAIIFSIYCYIISCMLLQKKEKSIKVILKALIPFLIMYYCVFCLLDSIYSMFFSGLCAFVFIRMIFKENIFRALFVSMIVHALKFINKIFILLIINKPNFLLVNTYKTIDWHVFFINLIALLTSIVFSFLFRNQLRKMIVLVSNMKHRKTILLVAIYLSFIMILLYQPPKDFFSLRTATDFIMIFTITGIGIFNISSEMKMEELNRHYQEIFEYSRANEELITNYKQQVHENKNRLLMINSLLDGPKRETKKYVEELLSEINANKCNGNYWLTELKYIPLAGVRNFMNYKLIQLREIGAEVEMFISSELGKLDASVLSDNEYNQLSTILGVILDNMIESVSKSEKKLVSINLYIDGNKVHAEFANNFSGSVDLTRLKELGYTTKGDKRGVGLSLIEKIIHMNDRFDCKPRIMDDFFIQHLTIKIVSRKNCQKISKK